jgi:hypothetical protein
MARFLLTRATSLPPGPCLDRLTDWPRHGEGVPFTRVFASRGSGRTVGDVVLARTTLGPFGFDDPMEIVVLARPTARDPGVCRLEKRGRIVRGWAELRVRAADGAEPGSVAGWEEEIRILGLPATLDPVVAAVARRVFARALDRLLS